MGKNVPMTKKEIIKALDYKLIEDLNKIHRKVNFLSFLAGSFVSSGLFWTMGTQFNLPIKLSLFLIINTSLYLKSNQNMYRRNFDGMKAIIGK